MFDFRYYSEKKNKINQKAQFNVQELLNAAVRFVDTARDLNAEMVELAGREKESEELTKKNDKPKK